MSEIKNEWGNYMAIRLLVLNEDTKDSNKSHPS
jgi:hypothetical protein